MYDGLGRILQQKREPLAAFPFTPTPPHQGGAKSRQSFSLPNGEGLWWGDSLPNFPFPAQHLVNQAVFFSFVGPEPVVAVRIFFDLLGRFACVVGQNLV